METGKVKLVPTPHHCLANLNLIKHVYFHLLKMMRDTKFNYDFMNFFIFRIYSRTKNTFKKTMVFFSDSRNCRYMYDVYNDLLGGFGFYRFVPIISFFRLNWYHESSIMCNYDR
jgi:hypothetical protein